MARQLVLKLESSSLILFTLATAIFPRVITAVGAPAVTNFLHFAFIIAIITLLIPKIQSYAAKKIAFGLLGLLGLIAFSALVNSGGVINVILDFLLLAEPFMLLLAIVSIRMSRHRVEQFEFSLIFFAVIHITFAYFQFFVLGLGHDDPDQIKGVFLGMGAGHHVGGAVALTAGTYIFISSKVCSIWVRAFTTIACFGEVVLSDAKQVLAVFFVALVSMIFIKLNNIGKVLHYFVITIVAIGVLIWVAKTIFPALALILDSDRLTEGLNTKFSVFPIIASYYNSSLNWFFGLGPGHTIGRLGWLIPDYKEYLQPLGVTTTPVFDFIFNFQEQNYFTNSKTGSSFYSPLFSWAGVWGDLGVLGLGAYLYLWCLVWFQLCLDDLSKFFLITIFIFGIVFSWMEEPGYMLFVISLIGLQWQKHQSRQDNSSTNSSGRMQFFEPT